MVTPLVNDFNFISLYIAIYHLYIVKRNKLCEHYAKYRRRSKCTREFQFNRKWCELKVS